MKLAILSLLLAFNSALAIPLWIIASSAGAVNVAAAPTFRPTGFTSPGFPGQTVTISTVTAGANIRFTKDLSNPTYTNGTLISASSGTANAPANQDTVIKAVAFIAGDPTTVSAVITSEYDFIPEGGG